MNILSKEQLAKNLREHYIANYGERNIDIWYEQPAANVLVFKRGNVFITLKSHITTGKITELIEKGE